MKLTAVFSFVLVSAVTLVQAEETQPSSVTRLLSVSDSKVFAGNPVDLQDRNVNYMDVTDFIDVPGRANSTRANNNWLPIPTTLKYQDFVQSMQSQVSADRMTANLDVLTSFQNRYYSSVTGEQSAEWLWSTIQQLINCTNSNVTVTRFSHGFGWSIIARFETADALTLNTENVPMVIVGSHYDTDRGASSNGRAPGADAGGSGTVTTLEAFSILCANNFLPNLPTEFHWYTAEEAGLLGSQDISSNYQRSGKQVVGMLQFDMTGYVKNQKKAVFGIVTDYTDPALSSLLRTLATVYGSMPTVDTKCKYACSDHAAWTRAGYRAAMPLEGKYEDISPFAHSMADVVTGTISVSHMSQFVGLALGFAAELAFQI